MSIFDVYTEFQQYKSYILQLSKIELYSISRDTQNVSIFQRLEFKQDNFGQVCSCMLQLCKHIRNLLVESIFFCLDFQHKYFVYNICMEKYIFFHANNILEVPAYSWKILALNWFLNFSLNQKRSGPKKFLSLQIILIEHVFGGTFCIGLLCSQVIYAIPKGVCLQFQVDMCTQAFSNNFFYVITSVVFFVKIIV
eukprot:TRINITY_DN12688_c0_g1_i19.p2 TRINITY_DN12688_c0_g1~~TRINITY_DN12688_c0_g1_i19.p2  ORF type:complete len:195 (+),score=-13.18 TRINITY_DN12688_c0_g1_i19:510-1094(+)